MTDTDHTMTPAHKPTPTDAMRALGVWALARRADVADPDSPTSAGAEWLDLVRTAALELIEDSDDMRDLDDAITESADTLVPVYTHHRMQVLVDLAAYRVDIEDLAGESGGVDMVDLAGLALYRVAETLLHALISEAADIRDEDEDEDEDGDA